MIQVLFAFIGTVLFIQIWKQCTNIEISLKIQPIFVFSKERSKVFYTFCRFIFTAWLDETEAKKWSSSCCYTLIFTCFMSVVQPVLHMSFCGTCLRQNSGVWPFFFRIFTQCLISSWYISWLCKIQSALDLKLFSLQSAQVTFQSLLQWFKTYFIQE